MRIKDYPETDTISPDDVFVIDGKKGTGCIKAETLGITSAAPAISHRNTYRGKNLGSTFTEEQKDAIKSGTFDDIYVGDYWVAEGINWRIADINYWMGVPKTTNSSQFVTENHLVIVPDTILYESGMNSTNTNSSGYYGSNLRTNGLTQAKNIVHKVFDEKNILIRSDKMISSIGPNGIPNSNLYDLESIGLMSMNMVFGFDYATNPEYYIYSEGCVSNTQLSLFFFDKSKIGTTSGNYWIRDPKYSNGFYYIYTTGILSAANAGESNGVRPVFGVTG